MRLRVYNSFVFAAFLLSFATRSKADSLPQFCIARCIASCLESPSETNCVNNCRNQQRLCSLQRNTVNSLELNTNLTFSFPDPSTILVFLDVKPKTAYVVEYKPAEVTVWAVYPEIVTGGNFTIEKQQICQKYDVRATPVNSGGVGITGHEATADLPALDDDVDLKLNVTRLWMTGNSTVSFAVTFQLPPAWPNVVQNMKTSLLFPTQFCNSQRNITVDMTLQQFYGELQRADPLEVFCAAVLIVDSYTVCGKTHPLHAHKDIIMNSCEQIEGCGEKCSIGHLCDLVFTHTNLTDIDQCQPKVNITIDWGVDVQKRKTYGTYDRNICNPHEYLLSFTAKDPTSNETSKVEEVRRSLNETSTTIEVMTDRELILRGCETFKPDVTFSDEELKETLRVAQAKSVEFDKNACFEKESDSVDPVAIAVPMSCILAACFFIIIAVARRYQTQRVKLKKMQSSIYNSKFSGSRPQPDDKWEIDPRSLQIYENEVLGKGAFGKVVKGRILGRAITSNLANSNFAVEQELAENLIVAVKVCHEIVDDATRQEFREEIELMKRLYSHPRLVNILYCVTKVQPLYLVVEYCPNGDLLNFLRHTVRKYMNELHEKNIDMESDEVDSTRIMCYKDVLSICYQVADGMSFIAERGFIHRDLAARNVLVCDSLSSVKIGDFGLCRYVETSAYLTRGGKLPIKWLALEAIERWEFSQASDVWAFGVFVYEVLTLGDSPYPEIIPEGNIRETMLNFLLTGQRMPQPANCSDELYRIMKQSWQAEPSARPEFTEIKEQLRIMLSDLVQNDTGIYGDYYIQPSRTYYNDVVQENIDLVELPVVRNGTDGDVTDKKSVASSRTSTGPLISRDEEEHVL